LGAILVELDGVAATLGYHVVIDKPAPAPELHASVISSPGDGVGVNLSSAISHTVGCHTTEAVGIVEVGVCVREVIDKGIIPGNIPRAQFRRNVVPNMSASRGFLVEQIIFNKVLVRASIREIVVRPTVAAPTSIGWRCWMPVVPDLNYVRSVASIGAVVDVVERIVINQPEEIAGRAIPARPNADDSIPYRNTVEVVVIDTITANAALADAGSNHRNESIN